MFNLLRCCLVILLCFPITGIVRAQSSRPVTNVTLQLKWKHQFQFAGYYAASRQGYYAEKGIAVTFLEAGDEDPDNVVINGKAEFGVTTAAIVTKRAEGKPVVVLAPVFQHSPLVLFTLRNSGLKYAQDLAGKRIMLEPQEADLLAYLKDEGLQRGEYLFVKHSYRIDDLLERKIDGISGYLTDETYYLQQKGFEYNIITPATGGIDFYGDCLFTTEIMVRDSPELVKNFLEASLKGWKYALHHQAEMVQYIYDSISQRHTPEHLLYEAKQTEMMIKPEIIEIGYSNPGRWEHIIATFNKVGLMRTPISTEGLLYADYTRPSSWKVQYDSPFFVLSILAVTAALLLMVFLHLQRKEITKREALQSTLAMSEERYRLLANSVRDVIWTVNLDAMFTYMSPSVKEMLGYEPEELLGKYSGTTLTEESKRIAEELREDVVNIIMRGEEPGDYRFIMEQVRKDGGSVWTDVRINPMKDDKGNFVSFFGITRDITAERTANLALQESKQFLSNLIENNEALIYVKDLNGRYILINKKWDEISEVSREIALGKQDHEIFRTALADHFCKKDAEVFQHSRILEYEENIEIAGKTRYFRTIKFPLTDNAGNVEKLCGMTLEITSQKYAEIELRKREGLWRSVVETSPDGIAIANMEGQIVFASPRAIEMWGYESFDEIVGRNMYEFVHPNDHEKTMKVASLLLEGINSGAVELLMVRKDKSTFYSEASSALLRDHEGRPSGLLFFERDITERKIAENIISENEKRFRTVFAHAPMGIAQLNNKGEVTFFNDYIVQLSGMSRLEIASFNIRYLREKMMTELFERTLNGERIEIEQEFFVDAKNAVIPIRVVFTPTTDAEQLVNGCIIVVEDITERKVAEERIRTYTRELEKLNQQLQESYAVLEDTLSERSKLAEDLKILNREKDKFFTIIAHDLKSPFQSFIGLTEVLSENIRDYTIDELTYFNRELHSSAVNLHKLLHNLLEWAKLQQDKMPLRKEVISLVPLIELSIERLKAAAESKSVALSVHYTEPMSISADQYMLQSVIHNLLGNAVKFSKHGGRVDISFKREGDFIVLSVTDTGIGMPPEILQNLFKIDKKTGRRGTAGEESTGLGLLLCKEFVAKHNGTISVKSIEGEGSTFTVTLPIQ